MGKVVKIDNQFDVKVTGVYEDIPDNSSFHDLRFVAPLDLLVRSFPNRNLGWGNNWLEVHVELAENVDLRTASAAIRDAKLKSVGPDLASTSRSSSCIPYQNGVCTLTLKTECPPAEATLRWFGYLVSLESSFCYWPVSIS